MKNDAGLERSIDFTLNHVASTHHAFIGLCERMWKAIKNCKKAPFKYMEIPDYDLTNFKMSVLTGEDIGEDERYNDITIIRFSVKNVFNDKRFKWIAFRDLRLTTFGPYESYVEKYGRYDFDNMWGWLTKYYQEDPEKYEEIYLTARHLTTYFDSCIDDWLNNELRVDNHEEDCEDCNGCDTCDCKTCPLARESNVTCPVRDYTCDECCGKEPCGSKHDNICELLEEYYPAAVRFTELIDELREQFMEESNGKIAYKLITSTGGTDGRLAVTVMFGTPLKAAFSLEMHYQRRVNDWVYRVPRSKKMSNTFTADTPEAKFIARLINASEKITNKSYIDFLAKYKIVHEDLTEGVI